MSRIVQQILSLLTLISQLTGTESLLLPFGLLAEKTWNQWVFSRASDLIDTICPSRISLEKVLTRKQLRELRHQLKRRVSRLEKRIQTCNQKISEIQSYHWVACNESNLTLPGSLRKISSVFDKSSPLIKTIKKFLLLVHYFNHMNTLTFNGQVIARHVDNFRFCIFDWRLDCDIEIGELVLCVSPTIEILNALHALCISFYDRNDSSIVRYKKQNFSWVSYDPREQFNCRPGCKCDECRSKTADCQSCLDDGCPDCGKQ